MNKMLSTLDEVREEKTRRMANESGLCCQQLSCHELNCFLNDSINLFASLGYTKTRTPEERRSKIEKYQQELQTLKTDIHNLKELSVLENLNEFNAHEKLEENLQELKTSTSDLCVNASLLFQERNKYDAPNFKLNLDEELAHDCNSHFSEVVKVKLLYIRY